MSKALAASRIVAMLLAVAFPLTASAAAAKDAPAMFPALASSASTATLTGPVDPLVIYYNVLHYSHASLTASTTPIEPPELYKFLGTPPRALGFAPPIASKSAFDDLDARVDDWVTKARQLVAHYQADLRALGAVETAYRQIAASADQRIGKVSPHDASGAIAEIVSASTGPSGHGAKLAKQLGYVVVGHEVKPDPDARAACDLRGPTADSVGASIFVEIPDACVESFNETREVLLRGILRAVIATTPADQITAAQADYLRQQLLSISLVSLMPNGTDNLTYATKRNNIQEYVGLLVELKPEQFELTTDAGKCKPGIGGTKTTIAFTATDRFQAGPSASVRTNVVTVTCYPRLAAAAGVGYTTLPKTTYTTTQTSALLNPNAGLPPAPAPTFQSVFQLGSSSQTSHVGGISLLHLCLCAHPTDGTNLYVSFGFIAPDGEPLGVLGGLTLGFSHQYYFTFGEHYGINYQLNGPNRVGDLVPQNFGASTSQHWILRPAGAFTIGL